VARVADWSFLAFGVILLVAPILLAGQVGYADFVIAPLLWIAAVVLIGGSIRQLRRSRRVAGV
jgi:hypothetical protein